MTYNYYQGAMKERISKFTLLIIAIAFAVTAGLAVFTTANAGPKPSSNSGSIGKVTLDTNVAAGINYGSGISNGEWVTAEKQGVEIGLRATDRTDGLLEVEGTKGDRVGVYEASTGNDGDTDLAEWNYEWHVDLSGAKGNAKDRTISDYNLVLEQDFTNQSLFTVLGSDPVQLPMPAVCDGVSDTLCQQSWNPTFGNTDFDLNAEGVYNLRLVMTPKTFNGPPLAVAIQVNVTD